MLYELKKHLNHWIICFIKNNKSSKKCFIMIIEQKNQNVQDIGSRSRILPSLPIRHNDFEKGP